MGFGELFILAIGLSMDAFAVSICAGLGMTRVGFKNALVVGLYFGVFQAGMPLIGYFTATLFADRVAQYSHWIAFALLCFLGGKMMMDSFKKEQNAQSREHSLKPSSMLPLAVATSIDAFAVGVSFAFLQVNIAPAVSLIGVITLVISMVGVKIGNIFGVKFKAKAQFAGGVILVAIGLHILLGAIFSQ
ncbi:MAG: manganese efflux pump MntP family protein [Defluviitaleaceae bacterium]|nr:manganese efflux pump MntP family protein [Defluviitaleaceae bacterium]